MPFGCFKKEKGAKTPKNKKETADDTAQETPGADKDATVTKESQQASAPASANGSPRARESTANDGGKGEATPRTSDGAAQDANSANGGKGAPFDPRSPRPEKSPRSAHDRSASSSSSSYEELPPAAEAAAGPKAATNRDALISSESSAPGDANHAPSSGTTASQGELRTSNRPTAPPPRPPKPESLTNRTATDSSATPATASVESAPGTPRGNLALNMSTVTSPRDGGSGTTTPSSAMSPRRNGTFRRASIASRGRTASISTNDYAKIVKETDEEVAQKRHVLQERKMTLKAGLAASLQQMQQEQEYAKRKSVLLGLDALDGLDLEATEMEVATFREEDYCEEALEDKILNAKMIDHLESDAKKTKEEAEALQNDSNSVDLNDLDGLDDALDAAELDMALNDFGGDENDDEVYHASTSHVEATS